jgi:hypothetical protein
MLQPGECSKILRLLGQFLEQEEAAEIGIEDHDDYVEVSWRNKQGDREERYHDATELAALRTAAELYRGAEDKSTYDLSELLRTLGQELDDLKMESVAIAATPDGFFASGRVRGDEVTRTYTRRELTARAEAYRGRRTAGLSR